MQVTGKFSNVIDKIKLTGPLSLYNGSLAAASATFVGHYPWFLTYNFLGEAIPEQDTAVAKLGRRAIMGFCSSAISDTCSNSIRLCKVYKQSYPTQLTSWKCGNVTQSIFFSCYSSSSSLYSPPQLGFIHL
jgi:hypothetical protein